VPVVGLGGGSESGWWIIVPTLCGKSGFSSVFKCCNR
jgi:hypothetical protein